MHSRKTSKRHRLGGNNYNSLSLKEKLNHFDSHLLRGGPQEMPAKDVDSSRLQKPKVTHLKICFQSLLYRNISELFLIKPPKVIQTVKLIKVRDEKLNFLEANIKFL